MKRTAVVQGASRGLGLAFASELVRRGYDVFATCRQPAGAHELAQLPLRVLALDVRDEKTVEEAAVRVREEAGRVHLLVNCAGVLHEGDDIRPEKKLESISPDALRRVFEVNAFGPLLVAKHFHPLLRHEERAVLANISARVGSIGDDRAGGWYAYRGSKAAQNLFTKNLAIELGRRAKNAICVALHPGTVDTDLSRPFQGSVPEAGLFEPERAATQLLDVIDGLTRDQTGSFLAWDGQEIPW